MPDAPAAGGGRQFLGQPWWIWAAGGAALIGGYIYLRRKASAAAAAQQSQNSASGVTSTGTSSPTGMSWEQFLLFLHDQQGAPAAAPAKAKTPPPPQGTPSTTTGTGQKLYWSGDLNRWMTAEQWHQWHVAHEQHLANTGQAA